MSMKGIVLAGGYGTRLYPVTLGVSKQLLPVYDKPMIYYPLSLLMLAGIRDILMITTPEDAPAFQRLLGNGETWGIRLSYTVQTRPAGLAEAFLLGKDFLDGSPACLVLGDNLFYGQGLVDLLKRAALESEQQQQAAILAVWVQDPERYGVITFDPDDKPIAITEKPPQPASHYVVPGIYFYPSDVVEQASGLQPSARGELEITDLNNRYLEANRLHVVRTGRGLAWLDAGTHEALLEAGHFVHTIESRQGLKIACLEEIAYRKGWIDKTALAQQADRFRQTEYGAYLRRLLSEPGLAGN